MVNRALTLFGDGTRGAEAMRDRLRSMFLLRLIFWLGLTYSLIDWPRDSVSLPDGAQLAASASEEIGTRCKADPLACLETAQKIESLRRAVQDHAPAPAPVPAPPAPTRPRG